jgi:cytochrome P450
MVKTYGSVSGMYFGTKPFLLLTDLDMIRDVTIKHFDKFVDHMNSSAGVKVTVDGKTYSSVFSVSGDDWRKRRRIISPAFSTHKLKLMEPLITESTNRLIKKISELSDQQQFVDVLSLYSKMTMEVMLSTVFGRSIDMQGGKGREIYDDAAAVFAAFSGNAPILARILQFIPMAVPKLEPSVTLLMRWLGIMDSLPRLTDAAVKIVEMRRKDDSHRKDLLQLLIEAKDGDSKLSTGEIVADAVGFLLAGYETTSVALAMTTYFLSKDSEVQEKVASEIDDFFEKNPDCSLYDAACQLQFVDMVISETLRIHPPAPGVIRICNERCVLNGVIIASGVQVSPAVVDIHMSPEIYPEPERFNPERFSPEEKAKRHPCAYLPFGLGPRNCVGMRFALLEAKMILIEVLKKYKITLSKETTVPIEIDKGGVLRPKTGVFLNFTPREEAVNELH